MRQFLISHLTNPFAEFKWTGALSLTGVIGGEHPGVDPGDRLTPHLPSPPPPPVRHKAGTPLAERLLLFEGEEGEEE